MAVVDMFLKIDGVDGESSDPEHKNEIQIEGFRLGLVSPRDSYTNEHTGVRKWAPLSVRASIDTSTPLLYDKLIHNAKIPKAVLTCRKAGKEQVTYFKVTLSEVSVAKINSGDLEATGGDVIPHCDFDLAFGKIEIVGCPQTSKGSTSGQVMTQDDLRTNK